MSLILMNLIKAKPSAELTFGGKRYNTMLVSEEDWSSLQETLHLLSIPEMGESIKKGMATPLDECSKDLE